MHQRLLFYNIVQVDLENMLLSGPKKPNCLMSQKLQRVNVVSLNTMDGSRPNNQIPKIPLMNPHGFLPDWKLQLPTRSTHKSPNRWNMSGLDMNYFHSWDLTVGADGRVRAQTTFVCIFVYVYAYLHFCKSCWRWWRFKWMKMKIFVTSYSCSQKFTLFTFSYHGHEFHSNVGPSVISLNCCFFLGNNNCTAYIFYIKKTSSCFI